MADALRHELDVGRCPPRPGRGLADRRLSTTAAAPLWFYLVVPRTKDADAITAPAVIAIRPATTATDNPMGRLPNQLVLSVALVASAPVAPSLPRCVLDRRPVFGASERPMSFDRTKRPRWSRRTYRFSVPVAISSRFAIGSVLLETLAALWTARCQRSPSGDRGSDCVRHAARGMETPSLNGPPCDRYVGIRGPPGDPEGLVLGLIPLRRSVATHEPSDGQSTMIV